MGVELERLDLGGRLVRGALTVGERVGRALRFLVGRFMGVSLCPSVYAYRHVRALIRRKPQRQCRIILATPMTARELARLLHERGASVRQLPALLAQEGFLGPTGQPYTLSTVRAMASFDPIRCGQNTRRRADRVRAARTRGRHTTQEWADLCAAFCYRCVRCGERRPLAKDHIRPLYLDGTDAIDNLQPVCRSCNSTKGADMTDHRDTAKTAWPRARIKALRHTLKEDVATFGARFARSGRTVEDWELGRRRPDPLVLLAMERLAKRRHPSRAVPRV